MTHHSLIINLLTALAFSGIVEIIAAIRYRRWKVAVFAGATLVSVPVIGGICQAFGLIQ
jgi:hypothetical protein